MINLLYTSSWPACIHFCSGYPDGSSPVSDYTSNNSSVFLQMTCIEFFFSCYFPMKESLHEQKVAWSSFYTFATFCICRLWICKLALHLSPPILCCSLAAPTLLKHTNLCSFDLTRLSGSCNIELIQAHTIESETDSQDKEAQIGQSLFLQLIPCC